MTFHELAKKIGARILANGPSGEREARQVCASDRMSDLLGEVTDHTLLVTNLTNKGLVRLFELMDIPGVCLVNNAEPAQEVLAAAMESGAILMVSREGVFETCGKLYQLLNKNT